MCELRFNEDRLWQLEALALRLVKDGLYALQMLASIRNRDTADRYGICNTEGMESVEGCLKLLVDVCPTLLNKKGVAYP